MFSEDITLFPLSAIVINDLLKDLQKIASWTAEQNI